MLTYQQSVDVKMFYRPCIYRLGIQTSAGAKGCERASGGRGKTRDRGNGCPEAAGRGAQYTCFTSTKVQILTQKLETCHNRTEFLRLCIYTLC
jgi:hypothetical protein